MDKDFWAICGTVGDAFGGIANFVTMGVVIYGAIWARNEVRRNREQHHAEVRADVARKVWQAVFAITRSLSSALDGFKKNVDVEPFQKRTLLVRDGLLLLVDHTADSSMFLTLEITNALQRFVDCATDASSFMSECLEANRHDVAKAEEFRVAIQARSGEVLALLSPVAQMTERLA
ncbi:MAG: hypothetical protein QM817_40675 [Archangium sp.]